MKAIIIAAGMGSRLNPLTNNKPKCMLKLNSKTLIEHQIGLLVANGPFDPDNFQAFFKDKSWQGLFKKIESVLLDLVESH